MPSTVPSLLSIIVIGKCSALSVTERGRSKRTIAIAFNPRTNVEGGTMEDYLASEGAINKAFIIAWAHFPGVSG